MSEFSDASTSGDRSPTTAEMAYVRVLANPNVIDSSRLGNGKLHRSDLPSLDGRETIHAQPPSKPLTTIEETEVGDDEEEEEQMVNDFVTMQPKPNMQQDASAFPFDQKASAAPPP